MAKVKDQVKEQIKPLVTSQNNMVNHILDAVQAAVRNCFMDFYVEKPQYRQNPTNVEYIDDLVEACFKGARDHFKATMSK